ncbi:MAG TPA: SIR2 family protein [Polyangiaceae bacterium]|nr:SIR2 family protein [Polyangiaceae bacterium]
MSSDPDPSFPSLSAYPGTQHECAVVLGDAAPPEDKWLPKVAEEFGCATVFVWRDGDSYRVVQAPSAQQTPFTETTMRRVASLLAAEGRVQLGEPVLLSSDAESVELEAPVCDAATLAERETVLTEVGLDAWARAENAEVIRDLVISLRSQTGVIPFVGAGASAPFRYPMWGEFLEGAAAEAQRSKVADLVNAGRFEDAAQCLVDTDKDAFYREIRDAFATRPTLNATTAQESTASRLAMLAPGPIITTNFDPVLETIFEHVGRPFTADHLVLGRAEPARVVAALQENRTALIKLHGDAAHPPSMIFTALEYDEGYGTEESPGPVEHLASVVYTNRPLLFLGCSLENDRTLKSLKNVHARNRYLRHYAILAARYRTRKQQLRSKELEESGIRTLWYRQKAFSQIASLLDVLVQRTAVDVLRAAPAASPPPPLNRGFPTASGVGDWWSSLAGGHLDSVADALLGGRVAFFLGAAVHPRRMLGRQFYEKICELANVPWPSRDRADAAQHVADIDRERLSTYVGEIVRTHYTTPSAVHRFLAALPPMLRERGQPPLLVLTTNYDAVLESAFADALEPYHLFLYNHDGLHAGKFLHRMPDGTEHVIRMPAAIREPLQPGSIIVKLNGGVDPHGQWRDSFVVASRDFEELSTRVPEILPRVVWDWLKERSLLFWGHGLREPDVRALTRRLRLHRNVPASWAVQLNGADVEYWRDVAGIEIIDADLGVYLERLWAILHQRLAPPS